MKVPIRNCTPQTEKSVSEKIVRVLNHGIENHYEEPEYGMEEQKSAVCKMQEEFKGKGRTITSADVGCINLHIRCPSTLSLLTRIRDYLDGSLDESLKKLEKASRSLHGCEDLRLETALYEDEILKMLSDLDEQLLRLDKSVPEACDNNPDLLTVCEEKVSNKEMAEKGKFILVQWESLIQIGTKLQTFIKGRCREQPVIKLGKRDGIALLEFREEKGVKFLKEQLRDDTFWTLTSITDIEETCKVKITNVPDNATPQDMFRLLTNKSMVHNIKYKPHDVEVIEKNFCPQQGYCVVKLTSPTEVYRVCKESKDFQPFKKNKLAFEPYYEEIDPVEEADTPVKTEPIKISVDDGTKLKYLRNFYKKEVEKQFDTICCKIVFLKEGVSRVKIEFNCKHDTERVEHARDWDKEAEKLVTKVFDNIAILRRSFSSQVWNQVKKAIQNNLSDKVWVDDDEESNNLTLVGLKDSTELKELEKALDTIEIPKPIVSKNITGIDTIRVKAFEKLKLKEAVTDKGVEIVVDKSVIRVKGDKESIKKAEKEVLVLLAKILVENSSLKSIDHAQILTTPLMRDKIEAIKDQMGDKCGYVIEKDKLTVFAIGGSRIEEFVTNINNLVKDERIIIEGKVAEPNAVKEVITSIERHFSPYVILKSEKSADGLIICVVCGTDYLEQVKSQLDQSLGKTMIREEHINLSLQHLDYLNEKYRVKIENKLKKANLPKDALKMSQSSWIVEGDFDLRSKVKQIVAAEVRNIKMFWKEVELDGIYDYFNNNSPGYDFLKKPQANVRMQNSICDTK